MTLKYYMRCSKIHLITFIYIFANQRSLLKLHRTLTVLTLSSTITIITPCCIARQDCFPLNWFIIEVLAFLCAFVVVVIVVVVVVIVIVIVVIVVVVIVVVVVVIVIVVAVVFTILNTLFLLFLVFSFTFLLAFLLSFLFPSFDSGSFV